MKVKLLLCKFFLMFPFHLGDFILTMAWLPAVCCTTEEPELSVLRQHRLIQNIGTHLITQLGTNSRSPLLWVSPHKIDETHGQDFFA